MTEVNTKSATPALDILNYRMQDIVDSAMQAVITIDINGFVVDWSHHAETMFGWKRTEALGCPIVDMIIPEEFRKRYQDGFQQFAETGNAFVVDRKLDLTALRRDKSEFAIELSVTEFHVGNQILFNGFVRDLSREKEFKHLIAKEKLESALLQLVNSGHGIDRLLVDSFNVCVKTLGEICGWHVGHVYLRNHHRDVLVSSGIWHSEDGDGDIDNLQKLLKTRKFAYGKGFPGEVWKKRDL